jgi:hypothetical protein
VKVSELLLALQHEASRRAYVNQVAVLDQSAMQLKARLYLWPDLFVQIYRNDRFDTTNMVLIYNGERLYARDQLGGLWHRHTHTNPHLHDTSPEGRRSVDLTKFLDEVAKSNYWKSWGWWCAARGNAMWTGARSMPEAITDTGPLLAALP